MMKNMTATTKSTDKPIEELKALRERVAGLTGPIDGVTAAGWANSLSPWETESEEWWLFIKALGFGLEATGAALALVEKVLPGQGWCLYQTGRTVHAEPFWFRINNRQFGTKKVKRSPTAPLAIILALLDASLAEEE